MRTERTIWMLSVLIAGSAMLLSIAACSSHSGDSTRGTTTEPGELPTEPMTGPTRSVALGDGTIVEVEDVAIAPEEEEHDAAADESMATATTDPRFFPERMAQRLNIPVSEVYMGKARKAAKVSVSDGPKTTYGSVAALRGDLPADSQIRSMAPGMSDSAMTGRFAFEDRNARVTAWLYAAKKSKDDNDYHLVIGTQPGTSPRQLLTVEVSGISDEFGDHQQLMAARDMFKEMMGSALPGTQGYIKFKKPIKVRVEGSLFYDWTHNDDLGQTDEPGPKGLKPGTAWELHPVTSISRMN